jgi:hypothetical protein
VVLVLIGLILFSWLLLQLKPVQNYLVHKAAQNLSARLGTEVKVGKVDIEFFNKLSLNEVFVQDEYRDTLLFAGQVSLNLTDWFFFKDEIVLHYLGLKDVKAYLQRDATDWNYQHIVNFFSSQDTAQKATKPILLKLEKLDLENIQFVQRDGWRGETLEMSFDELQFDARLFDITNRVIQLQTLTIEQPYFRVYNYEGNRPDSLKPVWVDSVYQNDPEQLRWNVSNWDIRIMNAYLKKGTFINDANRPRAIYDYFDESHIVFNDINAHFNDLKFEQDSIKAILNLSTKERSGFDVKKLYSHIKWHPEAMEFHELDLQTNKSRLTNYYEMRYGTFDNMSRFISKVQLDGDFKNALLHSDDIAFFAPELKNWNKSIRVNGEIKGTIDNLSAKNLIVEAGSKTFLDGNISMKGLPDITDTYIDFAANSFKTTYEDVATLFPVVKTVNTPYLHELEFLEFAGSFTGFINNFVAFGQFNTALGKFHSDLNMKFFENQEPTYKGNITGNNFEIGKLFHQKDLATISFHGEVNGKGLKAKTLNATLDGSIESLVFKDYDYKDILVKGLIAREMFNGTLSIKDTNFILDLDGLIDISKQTPEFNFDAQILKMNLSGLNLLKDTITFNGNLNFNFQGNNIDNFLGTAKIADASIYKSGERIAFDSLIVHSRINEQNKILQVESNEFDGVLIGNFSIKDLPASFQTFLHKYYPSYINPSPYQVENENFSFVFTTRNVSEYMDMFHKKLGGFNFSSVNGRINTTENLLDLNVDIPYFTYNDYVFQDIKLKGIGNYDLLSLKSSIGYIQVNDSLYFPNTDFDISSSNDISDIILKTSANKNLNNAQFTTRIQTMKSGVKVLFGNSNFNLNGKVWNIDRNGELTLTRELIQAEKVRFSNGLQEIYLTSVPSDISHTNDLRIDISKVNLGDFSPFFLKQNLLEGLLTTHINIMDPLGNYQVDLAGSIDQMRFDNDSIGLVRMRGDYYKLFNRFNFNANGENKGYDFIAKGYYQFPDSTHEEYLSVEAEIKETKVDLLGQYLTGVFREFKGFGTGHMKISGHPSNLTYVGEVDAKNLELKVDYTNVTYKVPTAHINFLDDRVEFRSFNIYDHFGNGGTVSRGILKHKAWNDLHFDFALNSPKILVLDTKDARNEVFYGSIIAKANVNFSGPLDNMRLDARGEPADTSRLFIHNTTSRESGQADFISWKLYGDEISNTENKSGNNLVMNLDVAANNLANMYVILDEITGDVIHAQGSGNLKMRATSDGEFTITGRYDIERGDYNFNFQTMIDKPFKLREGVGNYIQWRSDPYDADIRIVAEYNAENVRFSDLGLDQFSTTGSASSINNNVRKYRGEVIVVATLTDQLLKPTINFDLELPQGSPLRNDADAQALLQRIINDENELNKQVAFLIVFNSFGPLSTSNQSNIGNLAFEGVVMNTITGVVSSTLSRRFSTMFQKLFNDKSIKVNFNAQIYSGSNFLDNIERTGFNLDRTNLNLNFDKTFFKERLTFTFGSALDFGLSSQQIQATQRLQFLPDITAEWKIRPDGKLMLTFFYRDNYNYLSGTGARQNRSGASISWRKDFEKTSELFRKKKKTDTIANEE